MLWPSPNNSTIRDGGCRRQRQPSPRTSRALLTFTPTTTNPAPIPTPGRWEVGDLCPKALASSVAVLPRVNPRLGQTDCRRGDRRPRRFTDRSPSRRFSGGHLGRSHSPLPTPPRLAGRGRGRQPVFPLLVSLGRLSYCRAQCSLPTRGTGSKGGQGVEGEGGEMTRNIQYRISNTEYPNPSIHHHFNIPCSIFNIRYSTGDGLVLWMSSWTSSG